MTKTKELTTFDRFLGEQLKDRELTIGYLNEALENGDSKVFLHALHHVVDARGGIEALAKKSDMSQAKIEDLFSEDGNAAIAEIFTALEMIGFQLQLLPAERL